MKRSLFAGVGILILLGAEAYAACTDVPAPGVQWRRCMLDGVNASEFDLTGANLRDASFKRSSLDNAKLNEVDARRSKFVSSSLKGASLDDADLSLSDFTNADLSDTSLKNVNFRRAKLFNTNLSGADLSGANLLEADLLRANLSGALWIDGKTKCAEGSIGRCQAQR